MKLTIPELSLVVLIGTSGSGKSTFAHKHFKPTEVISSDFCRGLVSDDENDQSATTPAFEVLHYIAAKRLTAGRLTVIDATNVQRDARQPLLNLARQYHVLPVAIVLNLPEKLCFDRNKSRPDRNFGQHVIQRQNMQLRQSLRGLEREGFRHVFVLNNPDEIEAVAIERQPLWNNKKSEHGPFDIIGDVHGCYDELEVLLTKLGYKIGVDYQVIPPQGRKAFFVGDLVDRGPKTPQVLKLVMAMVESGAALCVPGNHDMKLMRKLKGNEVRIAHGLAESLAQLEPEPAEFKQKLIKFLDGLVSHYVLDEGKLVVSHAGLREEMQGRGSGKVRDFCLYGETTGEIDDYGLPVRYNWAAEYRGKATVVYGHTPVPEVEWLNNTVNIDTGCVFGGKLTALRYPEKEIVALPAAQEYYAPAKPLIPVTPALNLTAQQAHDDILDIADVLGKRMINTHLQPNIMIQAENSVAALEVMSRFAVNPKWLIYLPPTMSPSETSHQSGLLEHPAEAFAYYQHEGVEQVVCEEKHMGSRAVVIVCQDETAALRRFGVVGEGFGICYTRTGRRFFEDAALEAEFLTRVRSALDTCRFWEQFQTDWVSLDGELMPWSAKAQQLIRQQYAAVGSAGGHALAEVTSSLTQAQANGVGVDNLLQRYNVHHNLLDKYTKAYRQYVWEVQSLADFKLAPFHILATEGVVHTDKNHLWHLEQLAKICQADAQHPDPLLQATAYQVVRLDDTASLAAGISWWEALTGRGGEGMVVKPFDFIVKGRRGWVQPAVKCRGQEYLRIIYGAEYTLPENLERLRKRGLSAKRSLASRELALGIEGLTRFVQNEPLRRVHECSFAVLALESEPVDPRL